MTDAAVRPVPTYAELEARTDAPPGSSWHVFGQGDQAGSLNFLTPECVTRAAQLVHSGRTFNLDYDLGAFNPNPTGKRPPLRHQMNRWNGCIRDDHLDSFYLQSTSQIDGLRHISHPRFGFYGGVAESRIEIGTADLGIQIAAEKGIVGRGVLLDLQGYVRAKGRHLDLSTNVVITPKDLEAIAAFQDCRFESGDLLLIRFGWPEWFFRLSPEEKEAFAANATVAPGLIQSREMVKWLWDQHFSVVATDTPTFEAHPIHPGSDFIEPDLDDSIPAAQNGMLHWPLIALLGMHLGELWRLDELADECAADGRYEFMLVAKPLNLLGGFGSPANAVAIR